MIRTKINENEILIQSDDGEHKFISDHKIDQCITFADVVIIRFDYYSYPNNCNVKCLDKTCRVLWDIQDPVEVTDKIPNKKECQFVRIQKTDDPKMLKAFSWNSYEYDVDIRTGNLFAPRWTK